MATKVKAAPITLDKSLAEPIDTEELAAKADIPSDERKAILAKDVSDTMGTPIPEHPLAHLFPAMTKEEYEYLKHDIAINGQLQPIYTYEGAIIDGRHRYRASRELGITPIIEEWAGSGSLTNFVVAMNLNRRHLTTSQRAMIGLRVKPFYEEEARKRESSGVKVEDGEKGTARDKVGQIMNVSGRTVASAEKVEELAPDLAEKVISGEYTVTKALKEANQRPNADGSPRVPVASRQGAKPPQSERVPGALMELYDLLEQWESEYGKVPQLKPITVQVRALMKAAEAQHEEGNDIDNENFSLSDYVDGEEEGEVEGEEDETE